MQGKEGGYWNKIFMAIFGSALHFFFCLFLRPPRLNMVQFERSLPSAQGK